MKRLMVVTMLVLCLVAGPGGARDVPSVSLARAATQDGATIIVDTEADELIDNGNCSLREAIQAANTDASVDACPAGGAEDTIQISGGTFSLTCLSDQETSDEAIGDLDILTDTVLLQGSVITPTIVDGANNCRVLHVHEGAAAALSYLTIRNGQGAFDNGGEEVVDPYGGGIRNDGTLLITNSTIADNHGGWIFSTPYTLGDTPGGGVYNGGVLTIISSTITGNEGGGGGGVYNSGVLTIISGTISGNEGGSGSGVYNSGVLTITNSTISGNMAGDSYCTSHGCSSGGNGGGIANNGFATIVNSTVSRNATGDGLCVGLPGSPPIFCGSAGDGAGIANYGVLALDNCTVTQNQSGTLTWQTQTSRGAGGGVLNRGSLRLRNTLLAANEGGDCAGTLESQGYNLLENTADCTLTGNLEGTVLGRSAGVRTLADNGGPTMTHALRGWSAAIDAGSCSDSRGQPITQDQRGEPRPLLETCDIGAYEAAALDPYDQAWLPAVRLVE